MTPPFLHDAVAGTPGWMLAHAPLSVPDALPPSADPAVCRYWRSRRWSAEAETERDQTIRRFVLEDQPIAGGPPLWCADRHTTPRAAWDWFRSFPAAPGHRLVLIDTTKTGDMS